MPSVIGAAHKLLAFDRRTHLLASRLAHILSSGSVLDAIPARLADYQRRRMFQRFLRAFGTGSQQTIVDIGVTSDETYALDNYLEVLYPNKQAITAAGLEDGSHLEIKYPGLRFVRAQKGPLAFRRQSVRSRAMAHARRSGASKCCGALGVASVFANTQATDLEP
jgi:hypothetical protein